jgi:hypothetical protein
MRPLGPFQNGNAVSKQSPFLLACIEGAPPSFLLAATLKRQFQFGWGILGLKEGFLVAGAAGEQAQMEFPGGRPADAPTVELANPWHFAAFLAKDFDKLGEEWVVSGNERG